MGQGKAYYLFLMNRRMRKSYWRLYLAGKGRNGKYRKRKIKVLVTYRCTSAKPFTGEPKKGSKRTEKQVSHLDRRKKWPRSERKTKETKWKSISALTEGGGRRSFCTRLGTISLLEDQKGRGETNERAKGGGKILLTGNRTATQGEVISRRHRSEIIPRLPQKRKKKRG